MDSWKNIFKRGQKECEYSCAGVLRVTNNFLEF